MSLENVETGEAASGFGRDTQPPEGRLPSSVAPRRVRLYRLLEPNVAADIYMVVEAALILALGFVLAQFYVVGHLGVTDYLSQYAAPILIFSGLVVVIMRNKDLYKVYRITNLSSSVGDIARGFAEAFVGILVLGFVLGIVNDYSRIWVVGWFCASLTFVLLGRALASRTFHWLMRSGRVLKHTAIYGTSEGATELATKLSNAGTGVDVVGWFSPAPAYNGPERRSSRGGAYLGPERRSYSGGVGDLIARGQSGRLDSVLVDSRDLSPEDVSQVLSALAVLPIEVQLHVQFANGPIEIGSVCDADGVTLLGVQRRPISKWAHVLKSIEDYAIASIAAILFAPFALLIAAAIKIDSPGPVLFAQRRHGFNHKIFRIWKFRTMRVIEDGDDCVQAVRDDKRITRVGAFLRRTSLDEVPQLLNVFAGEMSIVGPRPHPLNLNSQYDGLLERYGSRHKVKPGITGLAQINGFRGPTQNPHAMRKRIEYDLRYIENWSIWLDLKIIAATPFLGIMNKNAF